MEYSSCFKLEEVALQLVLKCQMLSYQFSPLLADMADISKTGQHSTHSKKNWQRCEIVPMGSLIREPPISDIHANSACVYRPIWTTTGCCDIGLPCLKTFLIGNRLHFLIWLIWENAVCFPTIRAYHACAIKQVSQKCM